MRIAFITPSGTIGGAERVLLDLLRGIRALEPDWELYVIVSRNGDLADEVTRLGIRCDVVPFPPVVSRLGDAGAGGWTRRMSVAARVAVAMPSILLYVSDLRKHLSQFQPDIVHSNGLKMHGIGALAKPPKSVLVWHMHDFPSSRPVMAPVLRMLSARCALGVANSRSVAADFRAVCGAKLQIRAILNGVDLLAFRPEGPRLDLDAMCGVAGAQAHTVRIGLVATMAPWKGHSVFLRAMALVDRSIPVLGYIIGGPIYATETQQEDLKQLKMLGKSLGVSERVFFSGHIRDVPSAMRALDVIVHASTLAEPFGLVIAEAMATGRPVIVSPLGGAAEIIENGTFALSAEPGDTAGLAEQITRLAMDAGLRRTMGASGRNEAERRFDSRRFSRDFVHAYKGLNPASN